MNSSGRLYQRMLTYAFPYWPMFILSFFGFGLFAVTQFAWAELMKWMIEMIEAQAYDRRYWIGAAIISIFILRGIGSFVGSYAMAYVSRKVVWRIRSEIFEKLMYFPYAHYRKNPMGTSLSWITYHTEQLSGATTDAFKVILQEGLTAIALLGYLLYMNWRLTLLFLMITPCVGIIVALVSKRLKIISYRIQSSVGDVAQITTEAIKGYQIIKSYAGEATEQARFEKANHLNMSQSLKLAITTGLATPVIQCIVGFQLAVLIIFSLTPEFTGSIGAGPFMAYITAAALLMKPVKSLTGVNTLLMKGMAAAQELFEVIDREDERDRNHHLLQNTAMNRSAANLKGGIEFKDLFFAYEETLEPVFRNFNLSIQPGEMIALVGKTGSGKTTLTDILMGFYTPPEQQVFIDDQAIESIPLDQLRRSIGLVPQFTELFQASVYDNIAYGELAGASRAAVIHAAQKAYAHEFIESFPNGYDEILGEKGRQLSGGQKQRIAIARAILKGSPILILDEATSALDNQSEHLIQNALSHLRGQVTLIVIAHRLSTIETADRILVLEEGQIIEEGNHQTLLELKGAYARLYNPSSDYNPSNDSTD